MKQIAGKLIYLLIACALTFATFSPATAQQLPPRDNSKLLAPTPPMGWNSWDSYGETITEAQVRANADWMAQHLKQFGWQYVVIDEGWYVLNPGAKPGEVKFATRRQRSLHSRRETASLPPNTALA